MRHEIRRVLVFETTRIKTSAIIILGFIVVALFFIGTTAMVYRYAGPLATTLGQLSRSWPATLRPDSPLSFVIRFTDRSLVDLLAARPGLMCLITIATVFALPSLVMLLASDQIGSELGRRHIRFLLPRLSRRALYYGRALAAWLTWCVAAGIACLAIGLVLGLADPGTTVVTSLVYALWTILVLAIYALPFIALMSLANTFIPQPFLAYLAATTTLSVVALVAGAASLVNPSYGVIAYLSPTSVKYLLLTPRAAIVHSGIASAALLGYTVVFLLLGDWIISRRDL